jgi:hypothetical protein
MKKPNYTNVNRPTTFPLAAQCLNQLRQHVPLHSLGNTKKKPEKEVTRINLLKPTGHVMHQQV